MKTYPLWDHLFRKTYFCGTIVQENILLMDHFSRKKTFEGQLFKKTPFVGPFIQENIPFVGIFVHEKYRFYGDHLFKKTYSFSNNL